MIYRSPHPDISIPDVDLPSFVLEEAAGRGSKPALVDASTGRSLSYGELARGVEAVAAGLASRGIGPDDVVGVLSPNVPEYAVAFFGAVRAGAANTTLNPLYTAEEISTQLENSGARLLFTVPPLLEKAREATAGIRVEEIVVFGEGDGATPLARLAAEGGTAPDLSPDPRGEIVALPYSSGTTGKPKGVMLSHRNLVANMAQCLAVDPVREDEVVLGVLPFFHIYGMVVVMAGGLRAGATIVTVPRFDFVPFLEVLEAYGVTRANLVPPIMLGLAKHPAVEEMDLSRLQVVGSGAAPLGEEVERAVEERLACDVRQGYGLTETSPVTHFNPPGAKKVGSVGPAVPNTEVRIVDLETGEDLPPDSDGEVWIRGPQVMSGYLNDPEATASTLVGEWLRTGDIGHVDADGYLYVVDRAKELIKYKGFQVAPAELEDLLLGHPSVADVAVSPSPDREAGEVPKAFVVRGPGASAEASAEALIAYVADRVSPQKKVRRLEFVDEIPKSASGKILRRVLVERERAARAEGTGTSPPGGDGHPSRGDAVGA